MAKLYFYYSTMNAGKSTALLQASHNYEERGMRTLLYTAQIDSRDGGRIHSRIGVEREALHFHPNLDLLGQIRDEHSRAPLLRADFRELQKWVFDVFQRRQHRQQIERLEYKADGPRPEVRKLIGRAPRDVLLVDEDLAPGGGIDAPDQVEQRRLTAAGGAGNCEKDTLFNVERDTA